MAVFPEAPDGTEWQGESVAASPTSSTHSGLHIAVSLPLSVTFYKFSTFLQQLVQAAYFFARQPLSRLGFFGV